MPVFSKLTKYKRQASSFLLLWLLFSGQLFCTAHAGFGSDIDFGQSQEQQVKACCHGSKDQSSAPEANASCCENPASFCCGEGKFTGADVLSADFSHPVLYLVASFEDWLDTYDAYSPTVVSSWEELIVLRRSDPPLYLQVCSFIE
ncbi:hypothetical protein ACVBEJ_04845 [Porticoccus sp. GXU_MW_L64]